jgi:hypothetical protein
VSGNGTEERPATPPKDPVFRFLGGCVMVVAILAAILVSGALLIGWRLARDESPGRPPETFLVGDESRYWCIDLKPDDKGLLALFAHVDEIEDAKRRNLLKGTFLESFPLPHRRPRLDELAPFTLEFSLAMSDPAEGLQTPKAWAARGTFSHGVFRLRAAMKIIRFFMRRDPAKVEIRNVDGIAVTQVHDVNAEFAFANVGNRLLVASDDARMSAVLRHDPASLPAWLPELVALHEDIAIDGEDAWAFMSATRLGDLSKPFFTSGAAASFDVDDRDELVFRISVKGAERATEGRGFDGTREDCLTLVSAFLPGIPVDAIAIDGEGARRGDRPDMEFSGRITDVSKRLAALVSEAKGFRIRRRGQEPIAPETPSATPTPPTRPRRSGPRSGTPGEPPREGTPTPPR